MVKMSDTRTGPNAAPLGWGGLVVGLYAWTTAVYVGFVILDMTYARLVVDPGVAFRAVADGLLVLGGGMVLVGMAAIVLAARSPAAMKFLIASVSFVLLMFLGPAALSGVLSEAASALGAPLRIVLATCFSGLAFLGFGRYSREGAAAAGVSAHK